MNTCVGCGSWFEGPFACWEPCGEGAGLPQMPDNCGTLYCSKDGPSCFAKGAEIAMAIGTLISNMLPGAQGLAKAASLARKGATAAAKAALKAAVKKHIKKLLKKFEKNLKDHMKKKKKGLRDDVMDEILEDGGEGMVTAAVSMDGGDAAQVAADLAQEALIAADPTGLADVINSFPMHGLVTHNVRVICSAAVCVSPSNWWLLSQTNVAARGRGSLPFGSASLGGFCTDTSGGDGLRGETGVHCWSNINDGRLGNSYSWIPGVSNAFVGIKFKSKVTIEGFRVSRKGAGVCCDDRIGGSYEFQYTTSSSGGLSTPDSAWVSTGTFTRDTYGFMYFKFSTPIAATAVRLKVSDANAAIDELAVLR